MVQINTMDIIGNSNSSLFFFTVDSIKPTIILNSPEINSVVPSGTYLDFSIEDSNLFQVNYSVNGAADLPLIYPFNINTEDWFDGGYVIQINSLDYAGNLITSWYLVTIDSESPTIGFDSNLNHSIISPAKKIQLNISDLHLKDVSYSLNGEEYIDFTSPYIIDTSGWQDGSYIISIKANDTAQNEAEIWFEITIDAIFPYVISSNPQNNSTDIEINATFYLTFSEPMNQSGVKNYLFISPLTDSDLYWDETGRILSISFETNNLAHRTSYNLVIDSEISDVNGNPMASDFVMVFTTGNVSLEADKIIDSEDGKSQDTIWFLLFILMVIVNIIVLITFLMGKKFRESPGLEEDEGKKGSTQSPPPPPPPPPP
jgi:hypothetical protein